MSARPTQAPEIYSQAVRDVLAERVRQVRVEGWTPEHDDAEHGAGELAMAAGCYAIACDGQGAQSWIGQFWPFARKWWKPTDPRRMLIKAAALIIADIERRDRAAARADAGITRPPEGEAWIAETDAARERVAGAWGDHIAASSAGSRATAPTVSSEPI